MHFLTVMFFFSPRECDPCIQLIDGFKAKDKKLSAIYRERITAMRRSFKYAYNNNKLKGEPLCRFEKSSGLEIFALEAKVMDPKTRSGSPCSVTNPSSSLFGQDTEEEIPLPSGQAPQTIILEPHQTLCAEPPLIIAKPSNTSSPQEDVFSDSSSTHSEVTRTTKRKKRKRGRSSSSSSSSSSSALSNRSKKSKKMKSSYLTTNTAGQIIDQIKELRNEITRVENSFQSRFNELTSDRSHDFDEELNHQGNTGDFTNQDYGNDHDAYDPHNYSDGYPEEFHPF